jgi:uncharacterized protein
VVSLDLIRGLAVLGILAVNIAGFAGPGAATLTPHLPQPGSPLDEIAFATVFVVFEGKMRALFTLLFGASLTLFIDRAEAKSRDGEILQMRRLGWLMLFGLLHHYLLWWGDILFIYALGGIAVMFLRGIPRLPLVLGALLAYLCWHLTGALEGVAGVHAEEQVRLGLASAAQAESHAAFTAAFTERWTSELAEYRAGFWPQVGIRLSTHLLRPIEIAWPSLGETIPLMLFGTVLQQTGFFSGLWPRRRLWAVAGLGLLVGLAMTLPLLDWLWARHFPPQAMSEAALYWTAPAHLAMALGYAALLVLATPRLARSWLGRRLVAAGRMAFTNYIACTVMMTALFYGWGLGLVGTVGHAAQFGFVALAWMLMLGWSAPWLARFRQGPLEWIWRSLTERRILAFSLGSSQSP